MKINIEELSNTPDQQMTLEFHEVIEELKNEKPVEGIIIAKMLPGGIEVKGHVDTNILLECDRCTEKFSYHASVDIDEVFIYESLSSAKEIEITNDNFVEELHGRKEIDVTDLVYQSIILNIPSKNLCREECPGSQELQNIQEEKPIDPRLEIFKRLSENNNENNK